jgi:hypothetical protein
MSSVKKIEFIAVAREEFLAEVAYYNATQIGLGVKFSIAVERAVMLAAEFPDVGSASGSGTRRVIVKGFPFSVIYKSFADHLVVFAVAHQSRRPRYWGARVGEFR